MPSNRESDLHVTRRREGGDRSAPREHEGELAQGVPLRVLRPVSRNERSAGKPEGEAVRAGGGVYVYRTRKPASLLGLLHAKIDTPWWAFPIGAAFACIVNAAFGFPWWIGLFVLFTSGRHFAYVGETVSFKDRHKEHTEGGGRWKTRAGRPKPSAAWSDLDPVCVLRLPAPKKKWLLRAIETFFIRLLFPVYNEKKNKGNPRRITRDSAIRMRNRRNKRRVKLSLWNVRFGHLVIVVFVLSVLVSLGVI